MSNQRPTLLWVRADAPTDRTQLETACRELGIVLRSCAAAEIETTIDREVAMIGLELGAEPGAGLRLLEQVRERHPGLPLFVASEATDVGTMRLALQHGATDFLALPLNPLDLSRVLIRLAQEASKSPQKVVGGELVVVYGCRGGLGTTTLAVNLAVDLQALGQGSVAIVDLDLQRGDVAAFLNLTPSQSIAALAESRGEIDEIFLHSTMTRHPSGMFVLAAPDKIEDADAVGHDEVTHALRLLRTQYRYCVVDTPRTITGPVVAAFEQADTILVVTDRSVPGVRAAQRTVELLDHLGLPPSQLRLVVTEAQAGAGPVPLEDVERTTGLRPYCTIPRDPIAAAHAMNSGTPLNGTRAAGLSAAVSELATRLAGAEGGVRKRGGLLRRFFTKEAQA